MSKALQTIDHQPHVFIRDGEVFTNSRDVAEMFQKEHRFVLQSIDNLKIKRLKAIAEAEKDGQSVTSGGMLNFHHTPFIDNQNGREYRSYDMDRDTFAILAMGFTGSRAFLWKMSYIAAFNELEARQKAALKPKPIDLSDETQMVEFTMALVKRHDELKMRVVEAETRAAVAEEQIAVDAPKVEAFNDLINSDGLYGLQNAARVIGKPVKEFTEWLKTRYLFSQGGSLVPYAQFLQRGMFVVKLVRVGDKSYQQTFLTPRGVEICRRALGRKDDLFDRIPSNRLTHSSVPAITSSRH